METSPDRPLPPVDLVWSRVGQSITATGVLVGIIAVAAVLRDDPTVPTGSSPGTGAVWLLWTLAVVLFFNGFVMWMLFDQRHRGLLARGSVRPRQP